MAGESGQVVLLHGLGRTAASMIPLQVALHRDGFGTERIGYPSRAACIDELAMRFVAPRLDRAIARHGRVHVVTHSLGGLVLRAWAEARGDAGLARVVMIAPPNAGSEVVDWFHAHPLRRAVFERVMGPVARELVTGEAGRHHALAPLGCEVGILAGTHPRGQLFAPLLTGANDGKVRVTSAAVPWMREIAYVDANHTLILLAPDTFRLTSRFLRTGSFHARSRPEPCIAPSTRLADSPR